jgi:CDP-6-deoxy-D-xylo-4-hexulose-3-dehydrase
MIPLMKQAFYNENETRKELAKFILSNNFLSIGENCFEFERKFAKSQKRNYAVLFNSGGSANFALLQALKNLEYLKTGDGIGFSSVTWSTNVMPIIQLGMNPVAIDSQTDTLNSMSSHLSETLQKYNLKAFFITNALGFCGDLHKIKQVCKDNDIILIEDNCESLGTNTDHGLTGSFGLASTFSFFVAHHLSSIEGGMVCTDNEELSDMLKIVRSNGWSRNLSPDKQESLQTKYNISKFQEKYAFYDLGNNFKPTEITGFLGLTQLPYLQKIVSIRSRNYKLFESSIKDKEDLIPTICPYIKTNSCFAIPVICIDKEVKDKYIKRFSDACVEIRPIIAGNIQHQTFYKRYVKTITSTPGSDFLHNCGFYFGNCPDYTSEELNTLLECLER